MLETFLWDCGPCGHGCIMHFLQMFQLHLYAPNPLFYSFPKVSYWLKEHEKARPCHFRETRLRLLLLWCVVNYHAGSSHWKMVNGGHESTHAVGVTFRFYHLCAPKKSRFIRPGTIYPVFSGPVLVRLCLLLFPLHLADRSEAEWDWLHSEMLFRVVMWVTIAFWSAQTSLPILYWLHSSTMHLGPTIMPWSKWIIITNLIFSSFWQAMWT